jgi:hypothetical protein
MSIARPRARRSRVWKVACRRPASWALALSLILALAATCRAQADALSLSSGSGISGGIVTLQVSLNSAPGAEPAALQWAVNYPAAAVSGFTAAAGPAATAAGKSIVCSGGTCLAYGLNAQPIQNGIVATLAFQLSASASGNVPLQLFNTVSASVLGDSLSISAVGASIFAHGPPTGGLAQVAVDGDLTTGIFVLNTGAATASYAVLFFDDQGNALTLPFTSGATNILDGTLPAHGSAYFEADSVQPGLIAGWGEIVADPNIVIQALFRNAVNGMYYEAAVPSTPGGTEILLPFDATTFATTGQSFVTGVALANLDESNTAAVTCTARDPNGLTIANAVQVPALPPSGHWDSYQFPALNGLRGTIACVSNTNLTATALRFLGYELSSLPVVTNPAPSGGASQSGAIAEVAAGGNLTTGFFVLNGGAASAPFTINFFDQNGNPLALPFTIGSTGSANSISGTLPAQGLAYYEASNPQISTIAGWGQIAAGSSVVIQALFRNDASGIFYEAAVPSTRGSMEFLFPFDSTTFAGTGQQLITGVAIANLGAAAATVNCTAYDPNGVVIPNAVMIPALAPLGQWTSYQFPALTGESGTIDCVSNTNVSAIALRFLGSALSSLPVVTK